MSNLVAVRNQLQRRKRQVAPKQQLDELRGKLNSLNEPCSLKGLDYVRCHTYDKNWLGSKYVIIDNEYDGNCFFAAIRNAYILSETALPTSADYIQYLRGLLVGAEDLTDYMGLLANLGQQEIKRRKLNTEVLSDIEKFKTFILSNEYWADEWAIKQISDNLPLSIIIMSKEYGTDCRYVNADYPNAIILEYSDTDQHYRLIGHDGKFMFKSGDLPVACKRAIQMPGRGTVREAKQRLARKSILPQRQAIQTGVNIQQLKKNFMKKKQQALELIRRGRTGGKTKLTSQELQKIESFRAELRDMKNNQQAKAVLAEIDADSALSQLDTALIASEENIPRIQYMSSKSGYQQVQPSQQAQQAQGQYMMVDPSQIRQAQQSHYKDPITPRQNQYISVSSVQQSSQQRKPVPYQNVGTHAQQAAFQQFQKARLEQQAQKARKAQQQRLAKQAQQAKKTQQPGVLSSALSAVTGLFKSQQPPPQVAQVYPSVKKQLEQQQAIARQQQQRKNILSQQDVENFIKVYYSKAAKCYYLGTDKSGLYCPTLLSRSAIQRQKGSQRRQQVAQAKPQPQPQRAQAQRKAKQQAQKQAQRVQAAQAQRRARQQAQRAQAQRIARQQAQRAQAQRRARQQAQRKVKQTPVVGNVVVRPNQSQI